MCQNNQVKYNIVPFMKLLVKYIKKVDTNQHKILINMIKLECCTVQLFDYCFTFA